VAKSSLVSHAEVAHVLRKPGYSDEQIHDTLRRFPDPLDLERHRDALLRLGISKSTLMDRLGASP
jgi:hypothetical protein